MNLGFSIKDIRTRKKIKSKELADKCGISRTAMVNIEHGRSFPSYKTIQNICDAMGVTEGFLLFNCLTEDDVPEAKRESFKLLIDPLKTLFV